MNLLWTKNAKDELTNYKYTSKLVNVSKYIEDLINKVDILTRHPQIGKIVFYNDEKEIRQIIYRMHRILYYTDNKNVYILDVSHTHRNMQTIISYLKRNLF